MLTTKAEFHYDAKEEGSQAVTRLGEPDDGGTQAHNGSDDGGTRNLVTSNGSDDGGTQSLEVSLTTEEPRLTKVPMTEEPGTSSPPPWTLFPAARWTVSTRHRQASPSCLTCCSCWQSTHRPCTQTPSLHNSSPILGWCAGPETLGMLHPELPGAACADRTAVPRLLVYVF